MFKDFASASLQSYGNATRMSIVRFSNEIKNLLAFDGHGKQSLQNYRRLIYGISKDNEKADFNKVVEHLKSTVYKDSTGKKVTVHDDYFILGPIGISSNCEDKINFEPFYILL